MYQKWHVICYRNINSDGTTRTSDRYIFAKTVRGAKREASMYYSVPGRWYTVEGLPEGQEEYVKGQGNMIGGDRLCLVKIH